MEHIQAILDGVGNLFDNDPRTKGGIVLSAVVVLSVAYINSLFRRKAPSETGRVRVTVDAPKGECVSVRIGEDTPKS